MKSYTKPTLTPVGPIEEVIRGGDGTGGDLYNQYVADHAPFLPDGD